MPSAPAISAAMKAAIVFSGAIADAPRWAQTNISFFGVIIVLKKENFLLLLLIVLLLVGMIYTLLAGGSRSRHGYGMYQPATFNPVQAYR